MNLSDAFHKYDESRIVPNAKVNRTNYDAYVKGCNLLKKIIHNQGHIEYDSEELKYRNHCVLLRFYNIELEEELYNDFADAIKCFDDAMIDGATDTTVTIVLQKNNIYEGSQ